MDERTIETAEATYPMPKDGWVCFHCGERFTTEGAARDHFGGSPDELAGCQIKAGEERGLLMELRRAQERIDLWMRRAQQAEMAVERLECEVGSLSTAMTSWKPFRDCHSMKDVFDVYDSMEGRALAAEWKIAHPGESL